MEALAGEYEGVVYGELEGRVAVVPGEQVFRESPLIAVHTQEPKLCLRVRSREVSCVAWSWFVFLQDVRTFGCVPVSLAKGHPRENHVKSSE